VLAAALAAIWGPVGASARRLEVGPHLFLDRPSAAAAIAWDGDTIAIEPGQYRDCSIWVPNHLTILGTADGVVITGEPCERKALFVTKGDDITIRNITFAGARSPYSNGAGIRAEGRRLTIENSRFIDNQDGILTVNIPDHSLVVRGSEFVANGNCSEQWGCAHGVYAGHIALLRITGSRFYATRIGHHIKSRARRTELAGNDIEDGPDGTSSFLVDLPNGGTLIMRHNAMEKGPRTSNAGAAVMIGEEGAIQPTPDLRIDANRFVNNAPRGTIFVHNLTTTPAVLSGNTLVGDIQALTGPGLVR
jgi:hypothetical protein